MIESTQKSDLSMETNGYKTMLDQKKHPPPAYRRRIRFSIGLTAYQSKD